MADPASGKLELLFAHLSINNVQNVPSLLIDAIDEFQNIRSSLSYEDKKTVNFIKTLLQHVERQEWTMARENLEGAQKAYQDYIEKQQKLNIPSANSYTAIHGKNKSQGQKALPAPDRPTSALDRSKYLFKEGVTSIPNDLEQDSYLLHSHQTSNAYRRINLWSANHRARTQMEKNSAVLNYDEQGPNARPVTSSKQMERTSINDYPGKYASEREKPKDALTLALPDSTHQSGEESDSDLNRPSKIAESYTRLYEEEWHHAMTSLKRQAIIEETAIECLLYILMEAYRQCLDEARLQVIEFENAVLNIVTSGKYTFNDKEKLGKTGNAKHMVRYRREVSDLAVKRLQDLFLMKTLPVIHRRYGIKADNPMDTYARQCIAVTWRMAVQDPVLYISSHVDQNTQLHPNYFKSYKTTGSTIRYLVWPTLYLYTDGIVLSRGVAQGNGHLQITD
ncbi:uncharacterized protein LOC127879701 [Dreissena polymorpha]|uniref:Mitochondria-eating protein C-terminal domain-containing protein n=1 Tax=Dreissena polymorpha TaxID=45954 RepID=A0A9D4QJB1_DREPO|nr:uncharacterized protein LOC127879701 [Dreissena polymorpha]KAH3833551.1 hypothetical protein DPMN_106864 [Dreissena polymorpha]